VWAFLARFFSIHVASIFQRSISIAKHILVIAILEARAFFENQLIQSRVQ
jgi:hypothetical protein